jgi:hypothetical protein
MVRFARAMRCTNQSIVQFAAGEYDPVALVERNAQELALRAGDAEWEASHGRFEKTGAAASCSTSLRLG